jgi:hypothetical protein
MVKVKVGFELECNVDVCDVCKIYGDYDCSACQFDEYEVYDLIADKLECKNHKTNISSKELENPSSKFLYVYDDGSVNTEVVTKPLYVTEIKTVLEKAYKVLIGMYANLSSKCGAGCHMTISTHRICDELTIANIIQFTRYYAPALLSIGCYNKTHFRGSYRDLNPKPNINRIITDKYSFLNVKYINDNDVLFEFRYPDMAKNPRLLEFTALCNMAIVDYAMRYTNYNQKMFTMSQQYWDKVKDNVREYYAISSFVDDDWVLNLKENFIDKVLKPFLSKKLYKFNMNNLIEFYKNNLYIKEDEEIPEIVYKVGIR